MNVSSLTCPSEISRREYIPIICLGDADAFRPSQNPNDGHGTQFGRKQEEAIAALLTQRNIEEAAKAVGVAPNTLLKWMRGGEELASASCCALGG
jgi:hypothetical protein